MLKQRTISRSVRFNGTALHSGCLVNVELRPAPAHSGIQFLRTDLGSQGHYIKASPLNVLNTDLATKLGSDSCSVSTIEHLMAALFGFGIDNLIVALDGPEMPIVDGSAAPFAVLIDEAGILEQDFPRDVFISKEVINIVDPRDPMRFIRLEPSNRPLLSYQIQFPQNQVIGHQCLSIPLNGDSFFEEAVFARTFCFAEEVEFMRSRGLARGGSLDNALVVSKTQGLLNQNGLRASQEFVRHKILDCLGDIHLLGGAILGHIVANKAGHDLHVKLAQEVLAQCGEKVEKISSKSADSLGSSIALGQFSHPKSLKPSLLAQAKQLVSG